MIEVDGMWRDYNWRVLKNRSLEAKDIHEWEDWFIDNFDRLGIDKHEIVGMVVAMVLMGLR